MRNCPGEELSVIHWFACGFLQATSSRAYWEGRVTRKVGRRWPQHGPLPEPPARPLRNAIWPQWNWIRHPVNLHVHADYGPFQKHMGAIFQAYARSSGFCDNTCFYYKIMQKNGLKWYFSIFSSCTYGNRLGIRPLNKNLVQAVTFC